MKTEETLGLPGSARWTRSPVPLSRIAGIFLRASARSANSLSLLAALKVNLVAKGALSDTEMEIAYIASQLTPGTNFLALAAATGWQLGRWRGAFLAVTVASLPTAVFVTVLAELHRIAHPDAATRGAVAAAVGIVAWTVWQIAPVARGTLLRVVFAVAFLASSLHLATPVTTVGMAALVGALSPKAKK